MLPGRHQIATREMAAQSLIETLDFEAQANRVYRVTHSPVMRVFEVDRETDAPLRDVTIDAPPPPPPAPPKIEPIEDAGTTL
jgi:hypothetical protein